MRILLDHNVPESLRHLITAHEVHTAHYLGWDTLRNGERQSLVTTYSSPPTKVSSTSTTCQPLD